MYQDENRAMTLKYSSSSTHMRVDSHQEFSSLRGSLITELLVACQAILQHFTDLGTQFLGITRAGSLLEFTGMLL